MTRAVVSGSGTLSDRLAEALRGRGWLVARAISDDADDLDVLVHVVAPRGGGGELISLSGADWEDGCEFLMWEALSAFRCAYPALARSEGRIVAVVPTFAMSGAPGFAPAAAAAEGVRALVKGAAKQWGSAGITVNTIAVDAQQVIAGEQGRRASESVALAAPTLGSAGDPEADLAPLIVSLVGADAHFLTGSTLVADGGVWMAL